MRAGSKISVGVVIAGVLVALLVGAMLLVGSCTALVWNTMGGDSESGARRDALRAQHAALLEQLERIASQADDLQDAARRLRTVVLPPQVLGLSIEQADSDDHRIVVLRNYDGRQTSRILVNGAGSVTLAANDGTRRTFDLLEVDAILRDGTETEIELVLSRDAVAAGPE